MGDKVWVKPHGSRCTSLWNPGVVTKVNSEHHIEVDGVLRHVCDMRRRWADEGERDDESLISANLPTVSLNFVSSSSESNFERDAKGLMPLWKMAMKWKRITFTIPAGLRARRLPAHLKDFFVNDDFKITGWCN